ncbi:MAG: asparagine synthase (glutamine-hydrolyzing), partial [Thermodesulfobacteriota bacterium]
MCGISAYIHFSGNPIDSRVFRQMVEVIGHRGPDDQGIETFPGVPFVALGHRRLSIIDLSPAGHQPMSDREGALWIVFNGEIYNFSEIKKELSGQGHDFRSSSDTEVLLYAYKQWGERCLEKLNGMFAFAVWDDRKKELFAARDRMGIKPLYFWHSGDTLILASEIKSILASGAVPIEPDWAALCSPWHYQVSPDTGFKGIRKLEAGHCLRFSGAGLRIEKYWDIEPVERDLSDADAVEQLKVLIEDAVRLQMIADVPVGAFLSGGLDSSLIVAHMARLTQTPVRTFTIRFEDEDQKFEAGVDDSRYAREVADLFHCDHREITIKPDIVGLLPKIIWHLDEPLADPAAINTYLISQAAREAGVTVLLNGMGGDEVFGGYRKHLACLVAEQYNRVLPAALRCFVLSGASRMGVANAQRGFKYLRWFKHFSMMASRSTEMRFMTADFAAVPPELYSRLFEGAHGNGRYEDLPAVAARAACLSRNGLSYLTRMCLDDAKHFLPDHNLTYSDKATMAASVEGRPPLIDHRIVEFMFSLPPHQRIRGWTQKYLLKKAAGGILPKRIINRPKAPFGAPLRSWIRRDLKEMVDDILSDSAIKSHGLYNPHTVRELILSDRDGKED